MNGENNGQQSQEIDDTVRQSKRRETWLKANLPIHQQIPPVISAPSLVCHRVYWLKSSVGKGQGAEARRIKVHSEEVIKANLKSALKSNHPNFTLEGLRASPSQRFVQMYITFGVERIHVRVDLHSEYLTITVIIALRKKSRAKNNIFAIIDDCVKGASIRLDERLFIEPWKEDGALHCLFESRNYFEKDDAHWDPHPIGDFRGLVTVDRRPFLGLGPPSGMSRALGVKPVVPTRKGTSEATSQGQHDNRDNWYSEVLAPYFENIVKPCVALDRAAAIGAEFAANGLLNGRALFFTNLGADTALTDDDPHVRFFIHCRDDDGWQIGRLVQRICSMGSYRVLLGLVASHLDGRKQRLSDAARAMEGAEEYYLNNIMVNHGHIQSFTTKKSDLDKFKKFCWHVNKGWTAITKYYYISINGDGKDSSKDIVSNIARARFFNFKYLEIAKALRTCRIEGFQTYQEFVTRRMSDHLSLVESMRSKMASMKAQFELMSQKANDLNATAIAADANYQQTKIENFQEYGEFALICFLIPYYAGYYLSYPVKKYLGWEEFYGGYILSFAGMLLFLWRTRDSDDGNIFARRWWARQRDRVRKLCIFGNSGNSNGSSSEDIEQRSNNIWLTPVKLIYIVLSLQLVLVGLTLSKKYNQGLENAWHYVFGYPKQAEKQVQKCNATCIQINLTAAPVTKAMNSTPAARTPKTK